MKYVNLAATVGALTGVISPQEYLERLPELSTALPSGAAAYATEPGHYDFASPRCVHDLKLDRIVCRDFTATWVAADCPDKPGTE